MNQILFGLYPYIAIAVFLVGSLVRFDREQYTWRSGSSQLLRKRLLTVGSNCFHIGVLAILAGHFVGLLTPHEIYTNPVDGFVFNFLGVANFIPVEGKDGAVHIPGSDLPLEVEIPPAARARVAKGEVVAACRPYEIDLVRDGGATRGIVRRRVFLGSTVTYFISVSEVEIRAQQEAAEAFRDGRVLEEGEACGLTFQALRWFDKAGVGREAWP